MLSVLALATCGLTSHTSGGYSCSGGTYYCGKTLVAYKGSLSPLFSEKHITLTPPFSF